MSIPFQISPRRRRIFIVHNEPLLSGSLVSILGHMGFEAFSFRDILGAMEATETDVPDLLISVVGTLTVSDMDLAAWMQTRWPACKLLLLSCEPTQTHRPPGTLEQGYAHGVLAQLPGISALLNNRSKHVSEAVLEHVKPTAEALLT